MNFCGGSDRLVLVNQVKFAENSKLAKKPGLFNRILFLLVMTFLSQHHFIHNVNLISYGIWKIVATYADTFETTATAEFEVKEYGKTLVFYIVFLRKCCVDISFPLYLNSSYVSQCCPVFHSILSLKPTTSVRRTLSLSS